MRKEDIKIAENEIISRILENNLKSRKVKLIDIIYDVIYHEKKRLKTETKDKTYQEDKEFFKYIIQKSKNANKSTQKELLKKITSYYLKEITSEFKPFIYEISTKILPVSISIMLNALSPKKIIKHKLPLLPLNIM
jgi:hypothetical protein